jgi:hypothetical protein
MYGRDQNNSCNCISGFVESKSVCKPKTYKDKDNTVRTVVITLATLCSVFTVSAIAIWVYKVKIAKKGLSN